MTSNISKVKTWVSQSLATKTPAKFMGGMALVAVLMTATALPPAIVNADDPSARQVSQIIPDDQWIFGPPYFDDFQAETDNEIRLLVSTGAVPQITPDDEWIYASPYFEDLQADTDNDISLSVSTGAVPQIIQDDEWVFGFPYFDDFAAKTAVGPLSTEKFGHYPEDLNP